MFNPGAKFLGSTADTERAEADVGESFGRIPSDSIFGQKKRAQRDPN